MLSTGEKLPEMELMVVTEDGPSKISSNEIFEGKRVVLVGLPGAFTGTCSGVHLPGFIENADAIKSRGIDTIALVAVNDHQVLKAWAEHTGGMGKILFIADWDGAFTRAIDMEVDMSAGGLGMRSQRYSLIAENAEVKTLNVEEARGVAITSGAARILEQL